MTTLNSNNETVFPYSYWSNSLSKHNQGYQNVSPYPHIVLDNFLAVDSINKAFKEFPRINDSSWINYLHINERKHGLNNTASFPLSIQSIINELNSKKFLCFLSELTGIENLIADTNLEGGGLHQSQRGGFLNIHADFTAHPHHKNWRRRVNLIIYLNPDWEDNYCGHLELWSKDMKQCVQKITPVFNRCVIFNTDADSFHGHPDKLNCPPEMTRKSIALYYYTVEKDKVFTRSTNYKPRPGDGIKRVWIYMDKLALSLYTKIKSKFGLSDDFASRVLKLLSFSRSAKK
ncbi:MAG: 2OG-Fe(II) oxygenase [Bacteroidota bacterium]